MSDAELRLECLRLVVEYHEETLPTPQERLQLAEVIFQYLKTGIIGVE